MCPAVQPWGVAACALVRHSPGLFSYMYAHIVHGLFPNVGCMCDNLIADITLDRLFTFPSIVQSCVKLATVS